MTLSTIFCSNVNILMFMYCPICPCRQLALLEFIHKEQPRACKGLLEGSSYTRGHVQGISNLALIGEVVTEQKQPNACGKHCS